MPVADFMEKHFKHFNARETLDAARAYVEFIAEKRGKMLVALAGAMSTAELGVSLAEMIRKGLVHAISCTAANLEEDIYNLVAHDDYRIIRNYRNLTPEMEEQLRDSGYQRVTDTGIPEEQGKILELEEQIEIQWRAAAEQGESLFPVEYLYRLIEDGTLEDLRQIPLAHSWVVAAYEAGIPVYTPGFEDSTTGNKLAAAVASGFLKTHRVVHSGTEQMEHLMRWYLDTSRESPIGFFQIGGGIAGDFAICVVPLLRQDLPLYELAEGVPEERRHRPEDIPFWGYFAQISDSTTSYGSYSGAPPGEKITWWKLAKETPSFIINSDATIVAPLVFQYVLEKTAASRRRAQERPASVRAAVSAAVTR